MVYKNILTLKIIKENKSDDFFRLRFIIGKIRITTAGFRNRKELAKIIREDNTKFFNQIFETEKSK